MLYHSIKIIVYSYTVNCITKRDKKVDYIDACIYYAHIFCEMLASRLPRAIHNTFSCSVIGLSLSGPDQWLAP